MTRAGPTRWPRTAMLPDYVDPEAMAQAPRGVMNYRFSAQEQSNNVSARMETELQLEEAILWQ